MTDKQPEALELAGNLLDDYEWLKRREGIVIASMAGSAELLRTQHATLAKKDAAIKELREALLSIYNRHNAETMAKARAALANTEDA